MKIAWIDDDIEVIRSVVKPLEQDGHQIIPIRTVQQALDSEDLHTCALILMDVILPPGCDKDFGYYSGTSLLRMLREEHKIMTPVIVFSVTDRSKVEERLASWNVADYVRKPALPSELKEVVDAVLAAQGNSGDGGSPTPELL